MLGQLIVNFDHATQDGVVEGSLALSDLDGAEVKLGDRVGVMDGGAGPYEAEVIKVDGDRVRVRAPALSTPRSRPGLADAENIERWAGTHEARSQLPNLVRRLLADTPGVTELSMRAGRGVDYSGWDGRVDGGPGTAYVPAGLSCWEMSTSQDPEEQAQENYRKRTNKPEGADPATTTFVFVTPRRWRGKDKWEQSRRAEGTWRHARVLDADDLAGWLESQYGAHVWFSGLLRLRPGDVERLDRWWSRWSAATSPRLPDDLLLAQRGEESEKLRSKLGGNPSFTGVKAGSSDEAIAFIAAVLRSLDDQDHLARSFVVASATEWDRSVSTSGRSILIPTFEGADVSAAVSTGHHVVVPMGVDDHGQAIELPRIGRSEARAAFENIEIESDKADRLAVRARRSLTSLRRALSVNPRAARPGWAQGPDGYVMAVLVLVGAWSENSEADQKLVAEIAKHDYESVERLLRRWAHSADPPFRNSGNSWRLSNPEDAWSLLRHMVVGDDLERWREGVLQVLGVRDPVLDLDPRERFMAPLRGSEPCWSFDLRRGLAQGAALLATLELPRPVGGQTGPGHSESLVRDLLNRAGDDDSGKLWQQLSDVLPPLAEAAPDVFLEAVRRDSGTESPLIRKMFTDAPDLGSPWNENSPHTGLLWALETLCWSSDHLLDALEALIRLAEIDPEGRLANRPIDSATNLLLLWRPQTGASLDRRLRVLGGLLQRHELVGQDLSLALLSRSSVSFRATRPRFRDWAPDQSRVTMGDFRKAVQEVADRALAVVGADPRRLVRWIDELPRLFPEVQNRVIKLLQGIDVDELSESDRRTLWEALNSLLNKYTDREVLYKWLVNDCVQTLEELLVKTKPNGAKTRPSVAVSEKAALFDWNPAHEEERRKAVVSLYDSGGLLSLLELTERAENVALVGRTVADFLNDSELLKLLRLMSKSKCDHELAMSWIRQRAETQRTSWVEDTASYLEGLRDEVRALFFRSLSPDSVVWKLVESQERSVREIYWHSINEIVVSPRDIAIYVSYLLEYDRPWLAVRSVTSGLKMGDNPSISIDKVEEILTRLLQNGPKQVLNSTSVYHVAKLLDYLAREKPDSAVLLTAELALFRLLPMSGYSPRAVHQRLEADPSVFLDLVCLINSYPTKREEFAGLPRDIAWSIVHGERFLPGKDADGHVSYTRLHDWVVESRRLFIEQNLTELGDLYIGELLSRSPIGSDGVWPTEEIRRLLEKVSTGQLERGLATGAFNLRGEIVRDPLEGGKQERDLAKQYWRWAKKVDAEYPRTGRVLRQLARSYENDAVLEDERAERLGDLD